MADKQMTHMLGQRIQDRLRGMGSLHMNSELRSPWNVWRECLRGADRIDELEKELLRLDPDYSRHPTGRGKALIGGRVPSPESASLGQNATRGVPVRSHDQQPTAGYPGAATGDT